MSDELRYNACLGTGSANRISTDSLEFIYMIYEEGQQRMKKATAKSTLPLLSTCIRHVTVPNCDGPSSNHFIRLMQCLLNYFMLPNIELLDWMDTYCLPQSFFGNLAIVGLPYPLQAD